MTTKLNEWVVPGAACVVAIGTMHPTFLDGVVTRLTPTRIVVAAGTRSFQFSRADGAAYGNPRGRLHRGDEADVILAKRRIAAARALLDAVNLADAHLYTRRDRTGYIADPVKALRALIEQAQCALDALPALPEPSQLPSTPDTAS